MKTEDWIKVEDRLPENNGMLCLIVTKTGLVYLAKWNEHHRLFVVERDLGYYKGALSYWMPIELPEKDYENKN